MEESVQEAKGKRDDSTGAIIHPLFAFGVADIDYNVVYGDNQRIWYSIGKRIVGYDNSTKDMQFLPSGEHVQAVLQICIAPSKKYLAAIEQRSEAHAQPHPVSPAHQSQGTGCRESLTVFNIQKELPVRTLLPDKSFTPATGIDCIAFSDNGKLLLMACGPPDFTILCWRWYSGKVIASVTPDCRTRMMAFNPWKEFEFAAMAAGVLRTYSLDKESDSFKATNVAAPVDGCEYTAMTWLYGPLLVVADSSASIAMYKAGELLEMHAELTPGSIAALVPRARGLLAAAASGQLLVVEPAEGGSRKQGSGTMFHVSSTMDLGVAGHQVLHMAISSSGNHITVCTNSRELVFMQLENLHERQQTLAIVHPEFDEQDFALQEIMAKGFHTGSIIGLDTCAAQPLVATCSTDRSVRVWNWSLRTCLVAKQMLDDVCSIALHPSGSMLLVGLYDKLKMCSVVKNDLLDVRDFSLKKCKVVRFSRGGHLFAATGRSTAVTIYNTYTHQQVALLQAHVSEVSSMDWSRDDLRLATIGAGGACYTWDTATWTRISVQEYVDKKMVYQSVAFDSKASSVVARSSDGHIQHLRKGVVEFETTSTKGDIAPVAMIGDDHILLAGTSHGAVSVYPWPHDFSRSTGLLYGSCQDVTLHHGSLTQLRVSGDDALLFTASDDGVLIVSQLTLVLDGLLVQPTASKDIVTTIPVPAWMLEHMRERMRDLAAMTLTARTKAEYRAMLEQQKIEAELVKTKEELQVSQQREEAAQKALDNISSEKEREHLEVVKQLEDSHLLASEQLEKLYEQKLELQAERMQQLRAAKDDTQFEGEEAAKRQRLRFAEEKAELSMEWQAKVEGTEKTAAEERERLQGTMREWKQMLNDTEEDADEHAQMMDGRFSDQNHEFRERERQLKLQNKFITGDNLYLKGKRAEDKKVMDQLQTQNTKKQDEIDNLKASATALEGEIVERDDIIATNYAAIQMLRRQVQELEKHKYVLGHRAQDFQDRFEPAQASLQKVQKELREQDKDLVKQLEQADDLRRKLSEKEAAMKVVRRDLEQTKAHAQHQEQLLASFSRDLFAAMQLSDDRAAGGKSARQKAIYEMYKKLCCGKPATSDQQVQQQLLRQMHVTELKSQLLEHRLQKQERQKRRVLTSKTSENAQLLQELAALSRDNYSLKRQLHAAQRALAQAQPNTQHSGAVAEPASGLHEPGEEVQEGPCTLAGRAQPSRPLSCRTASSSQPASRPMSAAWSPRASSGRDAAAAGAAATAPARGRPWSAAGNMRRRPWSAAELGPQRQRGHSASGRRGAGGLRSGTVVKGSAARALHEVLGMERQRVEELMTQLEVNDSLVSDQQGELTKLKVLLHQHFGGDVGEDEDDEVIYRGAVDDLQPPPAEASPPPPPPPRSAAVGSALVSVTEVDETEAAAAEAPPEAAAPQPPFSSSGGRLGDSGFPLAPAPASSSLSRRPASAHAGPTADTPDSSPTLPVPAAPYAMRPMPAGRLRPTSAGGAKATYYTRRR